MAEVEKDPRRMNRAELERAVRKARLDTQTVARRIADETVSAGDSGRPSLPTQLERVWMLADWSDRTQGAVTGAQIRALMVDPRGNDDIGAASTRTDHEPGCGCARCYNRLTCPTRTVS